LPKRLDGNGGLTCLPYSACTIASSSGQYEAGDRVGYSGYAEIFWVAGVKETQELTDLVVSQTWRWPFLHRPSKGISIHKQADYDVVHLRRFREADGLTHQAFDAGS
jgi:hypothetical protein